MTAPERLAAGGAPPIGTTLIGACLLFFYALTFSGTFTADDEHILASRALGLAFDGRLDDLRAAGNSRVFAFSRLPGEQASQALNIEPAQTAAGALLARLSLLTGGGRVQTIFLLNLWVTALTALILNRAAASLGCSPRTGWAAALLFGLCSQAWPYARSYFRDPLAMLFLAFAWWKAVELAGAAAGSPRRLLLWIQMLLGLALGVLSKNTVLPAVPALFVLLLLQGSWNRRLNRRGWAAPAAAAALLAAAGLWVWLAGRIPSLARFSPAYYAGLLRFFVESSHNSLVPALLGPLFSPGKSILLYSPVLLLALPAAVRDWRLAAPAWAYLLLLILGQGLFYGADWPGHVSWGLRFALPALPVMIIATLPLLDRLLQRSGGRTVVLFLAASGLIVQLAGVLTPVREYHVAMARIGPEAAASLGIWSPAYSPILWSARWLAAGGAWDLAARRVGWAGPAAVFAAFLPALTLAAFAARRSSSGRAAARWAAACLAAAWLATLTLPRIYVRDPAYHPDRGDLVQARAALERDLQPGDLLALNAYGTPAWGFWMNWGPARPAWTSLPFAGLLRPGLQAGAELDDPQMAELERSLSGQLVAGRRVWLLLPCDSPASEAGLQGLLAGQPGRVSRRTFQEGGCSTSLLLLTPFEP